MGLINMQPNSFVCLQVKNGHVEHLMDKEIKYYAIEVEGRDME